MPSGDKHARRVRCAWSKTRLVDSNQEPVHARRRTAREQRQHLIARQHSGRRIPPGQPPGPRPSRYVRWPCFDKLLGGGRHLGLHVRAAAARGGSGSSGALPAEPALLQLGLLMLTGGSGAPAALTEHYKLAAATLELIVLVCCTAHAYAETARGGRPLHCALVGCRGFLASGVLPLYCSPRAAVATTSSAHRRVRSRRDSSNSVPNRPSPGPPNTCSQHPPRRYRLHA